MVLIVLALVITGSGVYLVQNMGGQSVSPNNAAVIARLPSPTATATTQPTLAPTATATVTPTATSAPRPRPTATSTPSPTATPAPGPFCMSGASLCSSVSALQTPCPGQPGVTFQLSNTGKTTLLWVSLASSINGSSLVSISPSGGSLKPGRKVTVTVTAQATGKGLTGTLTIMTGLGSNQSLVIALQVC
jgi:hypothetical protein